jgi:pimeloyl-ACP methyl ester carboxylesterase
VSTPKSVELPDGVTPVTIRTSRGSFAALDAVPASGVCERETAVLVPGFTGSKEDFLAVLGLLADRSRRVVAIDLRGQYETPGPADDSGFALAELGADVAAVVEATGARHLLGHSYGGLVARAAVLDAQAGVGSLTMMSSGPAALTGPRADELSALLAGLGAEEGADGPMPAPAELRTRIGGVWRDYLEPQAVAAGVPGPVVAFLAKRMLSNDPNGLVFMARNLLSAADRTAELARRVRAGRTPVLVIYGENDNSWSPDIQEVMARRLDARRVCIPGAEHSPAVEAPATTAAALTQFWDAAEATRPPAQGTQGVQQAPARPRGAA